VSPTDAANSPELDIDVLRGPVLIEVTRKAGVRILANGKRTLPQYCLEAIGR
jgi:hypothetical protein